VVPALTWMNKHQPSDPGTFFRCVWLPLTHPELDQEK
jgi:hypothetical protein